MKKFIAAVALTVGSIIGLPASNVSAHYNGYCGHGSQDHYHSLNTHKLVYQFGWTQLDGWGFSHYHFYYEYQRVGQRGTGWLLIDAHTVRC